jgi:hypothetical protein
MSGTFAPKRAQIRPERRPMRRAIATKGRNTLPEAKAEYS